MHCDKFKAKTMWKVLTIFFSFLLYFLYCSTAAQVYGLHFPVITKV